MLNLKTKRPNWAASSEQLTVFLTFKHKVDPKQSLGFLGKVCGEVPPSPKRVIKL